MAHLICTDSIDPLSKWAPEHPLRISPRPTIRSETSYPKMDRHIHIQVIRPAVLTTSHRRSRMQYEKSTAPSIATTQTATWSVAVARPLHGLHTTCRARSVLVRTIVNSPTGLIVIVGSRLLTTTGRPRQRYMWIDCWR